MERYIKATYSDGKFKPECDMRLEEGTQVRLLVIPADISSEEARGLANAVFNGLGEREIKEIEEIALASHGFAQAGQSVDRTE